MQDNKPHPLLSLGNQLCFAAYSTSHAFTKVYAPLLEPLGLTYPQYLVMLVLWEQDEISVKDIGAKLYLDSGTLTPLLKRLESAELLTRVRDKNDERKVIITLTEKGRNLSKDALSVAKNVGCATQKKAEDALRLISELTELRNNLMGVNSSEAK